jgi:hypothetical protein
MSKRAAQIPPIGGADTSAARQPFLRSIISLGRCIDSAKTTAPLLIEEASWYADKQLGWTGVALAGEVASEGLWAWQVKNQREKNAQERAL